MPSNQLTKCVFRISGMHCTACALNIDLDLEEIPGIKSSQTSYAKQQTVVDFDPSLVTAESIKSAISKTGYTASL